MSTVRIERDGAVAIVTLNRPDNANVPHLEMARELRKAAHDLESDSSVRAVVLTGAGKHFCFGGDLRGMITGGAEIEPYLRELTDDLHAAVATFVHLPAPVIAAVNGTAAGAGVGLVAMSDLAVAGEGTRFSLAYTGVALTPDGGTSFFLPRLIGAKRAMELLLTPRALTAAEALEWGLVNRVVPDGEVLSAALEWARQLAIGPQAAYAKTKRLLAPSRSALEAHLSLEGRTIAGQASSPEGIEGIRAFLEKRRPQFSE
ncbi:MAG: enoyl-CoA hydratase/isomerase family protein [Steroidobacteraceae bacterium]